MSMTYDEFKDYVITHLWKKGDQEVIDNLDKIILTAEVEINRDLKVEDRVNIVTLTHDSYKIPVPDDFKSARHIFDMECGPYKYVVPAEFSMEWASWQGYGNTGNKNTFTSANGYLLLSRTTASPTAPRDLELWYNRKVPRYSSLDFSDPNNQPDNWVIDNYFDVYLYCVLKHTAPFLREDERLAVWGSLHSDAMRSALDDDQETKYSGSPLKLSMPSGIR